jgi:hypothetical protein
MDFRAGLPDIRDLHSVAPGFAPEPQIASRRFALDRQHRMPTLAPKPLRKVCPIIRPCVRRPCAELGVIVARVDSLFEAQEAGSACYRKHRRMQDLKVLTQAAQLASWVFCLLAGRAIAEVVGFAESLPRLDGGKSLHAGAQSFQCPRHASEHSASGGAGDGRVTVVWVALAVGTTATDFAGGAL